MICLLVMTDGRDEYLAEAMESAAVNLSGPITRVVIHDDTADLRHANALATRWPHAEVVAPQAKAGFGGAIRNAWAHIAGGAERFVFHLEDDFTFNRPVDLQAMAAVLDTHPHLAQLALRRQPWNDLERDAGGIVEQHPGDYVDCTDGTHKWLEHRRCFTTNPSLYRASLCKQSWPRGPESEGRFTHQLLASPKARFGFWGARGSGEAVTHIGHQRVGMGY